MSKKEEEKKERVFLGRPGNNVSIGIVGMPNIGKSSLFNELSNLHVPAENYPFCTIDPNVAKVPVPDARFDFLCEFFKPKSRVPAVLSITDIAGLVKGAAEGKGLGNAFLSHISAVDAIFHLCRAFKDTEVEHVEGEVDPVRDLQIITEELIAKDLAYCNTQVDICAKVVQRNGQDKVKKQELETLLKVQERLKAGKDVRGGEWNIRDIEVLIPHQFLTAKPIAYLVNVSTQDYITKKNKWLKPIFDWVQTRDPGATIVPFSASFESHIMGLDADARKKYLEENKVPSALPKVILTGYHTLDLIHYFTSGEDEVRAWTIRKGTKAPQAAGVIHTDFERGFISAEQMGFDDFKSLGSEAAVRAAGKYKSQGKLYEVHDGDILFFKFNVSNNNPKKK